MTPEKERKNKRVGMAVSLSVHLAILLLFAFLMAWRAPDPPLPEYGIELNFGTSDVGSGDIQPPPQVTPSESEEEAKPEEVPETEEVVEESQETPVEAQDESEPQVVEESVEEVYEDPESSDVVKETDPVPTEAVKEEKKEEKEEVKPNPAEEKKEVDKPAEKVEKPVEKPDDGAKGKDGESNAANANQGDKTDEVGDQGNEEGNIDARALYGNPGGGGGSALQMAGWTWDFKPNPKDNSNEAGRIVFKITIDDEGEIIGIQTIETTVSPSVRSIYENEVRKLTFSKTDNAPPAPTSVGQITFIIKAK